MTDNPADLFLQAARKLWGDKFHRRGNVYRWGGKEGKKIDLRELVWHDFTGATTRPDGKPGGGWTDLCKIAGNLPKPNGPRPNGQTRRAEFQRVHDFRDEQRHLLFQECKRWDGTWVQRAPDGHGSWSYKVAHIRKVLFRLPELIAADPSAIVFITEGPKDADALVAFGLVATCNPGGAGKWLAEYNECLKGRTCVILPDCDKAGERHENIVREALNAVATVYTVRLPGLVFGDQTNKDVSNWIERGGSRDELKELVREARGEKPAWRALCQLSDAEKNPTLVPNLLNAHIGVSNAPRFKRFLSFDRLKVATIYRQHKLEEDDVTEIRKYLQHNGLKRVGREDVRDAIENHARTNSFHPIMQYFDTLRHDGSPRVDSWLTAYLGAESNPYTAKIGRLFLIAMVARIFKPGCQCDYMLVLEGEQGELKSSACRALAAPWFDDNLPDLSTREASQYLRGKWLVEITEMHAFKGKSNSLLKSFISRRVEEYFSRYGRSESIEPRQCLLIGTTNKKFYLQDETGGRRYWPILCGTIRLDALLRDRDQLFAEAINLYKADQPWWPDREFEKEFITPEQEDRFDHDAWHEPIGAYLKSCTIVTVLQVATQALGFEKARLGKADQMRIAQSIQKHGWRAKTVNNVRSYLPK